MPIKVKMEDGTEIETLSPEELQANNDAIAKLQEDLKKAQEKGTNFDTLKTGFETELKKKDDELTGVKTKLDDYIGKNQAETKSEIINNLAGGDKDLATKIESEFNGFAGSVTTKAEILERAKKAFNIVSPATAPTAIDLFMKGIGGRGAVVSPNNIQQETPEQAAVRRKMGISDEDFKKYGNKI
jgi:chromosome segregation ATPase